VVRVENLFYNVPARLKFLKSDTTERSQIDGLVTRYAMAYPSVRFHLMQENKVTLQTSGNGERREALGALYGVEIARQMLEVLAESEGLRVTGFISPLTLTRSNRREITFFVNGRPVQDVTLVTALVQAYQNLIMVGRYPMAVIFLDLDPSDVDVNVHPTKAEVRFRERDQVFSAVQRAVRRALLAYAPVHGLDIYQSQLPTWRSSGNRQSDDSWISQGPAWPSPEDVPPTGTGQPDGLSSPATGQGTMPAARLPLLRLVGQIASTYLVAEGPDGLYLIDQHAAHERVLFEQMIRTTGEKIHAQTLLQPAVVTLSPAAARLLAPQLPTLEAIGFQVEPFGPNTFLVRAIPALIAGADPATALSVVVEEFEEDETPLQAEIEAKIIARVCKRAAVKAGQTLSPEEQRSLLAGLEACESPRTCPHGRPTMVHLSVDLLERQFGRKGAR
jgi:DNA mismatch repair protein MutL